MAVLLTYGCSKKENEQLQDKPEEEITGFSLKQFTSNKTSFVLEGETAEISGNEGTSISEPTLSLKTPTESIEITTGKEGKGEVKIVPDKKMVQTVIISGNIKITYKDIKTGRVTMEGRCKKLTYNDAERMLIMEGSPVIIRDKNYFKGDVIQYNIDKNTLELKGNVNARIYTEEVPD